MKDRGRNALGGRSSAGLSEWTVGVDEARALTADCELASLFFNHDGYLIHKWTHYFAAYEEQLGSLRGGLTHSDGTQRPVRLLEIGVSRGGSLELWRKYLGPSASIWGVDIDERCASLDGEFNVRIGSQDDSAFLRAVVEEMGGIDVVLDDGSHVADHQRASFRTLFPLLSEGGVYGVEDLHTSYWRGHGGGYRRGGTFVEVAKGLVDDMHAWYHSRGDTENLDAARTVGRITFYDSLVFITKANRGRPLVTKVGSSPF